MYGRHINGSNRDSHGGTAAFEVGRLVESGGSSGSSWCPAIPTASFFVGCFVRFHLLRSADPNHQDLARPKNFDHGSHQTFDHGCETSPAGDPNSKIKTPAGDPVRLLVLQDPIAWLLGKHGCAANPFEPTIFFRRSLSQSFQKVGPPKNPHICQHPPGLLPFLALFGPGSLNSPALVGPWY